MRMFAAALAAFAISALPAHAEQLAGGGYTQVTLHGSDTSGYWNRCASGDVYDPERALTSCGRLIGARVSRTTTASAQLFRARIYACLGLNDRALAEFNQAYTTFSAAVAGDDDNAVALYGRGLAAISLGRESQGHADVVRATMMDPEAIEQAMDAGLR